jgi:hypothetical protein
MGANNGAINEQMFEVWISGTKLMQLLEDASFSPTGKALIDSIPVAVFFGKQPPLSATARNPEDGREEAPTLPLSADVKFRTRAQEGQDLLPLLVCECYC